MLLEPVLLKFTGRLCECSSLGLLRLEKDTFPQIELELKSTVQLRHCLDLSKSRSCWQKMTGLLALKSMEKLLQTLVNLARED